MSKTEKDAKKAAVEIKTLIEKSRANAGEVPDEAFAPPVGACQTINAPVSPRELLGMRSRRDLLAADKILRALCAQVPNALEPLNKLPAPYTLHLSYSSHNGWALQLKGDGNDSLGTVGGDDLAQAVFHLALHAVTLLEKREEIARDDRQALQDLLNPKR